MVPTVRPLPLRVVRRSMLAAGLALLASAAVALATVVGALSTASRQSPFA